ncbi:hypothetical protein A9P82_12280 [Arachidicoccus ginsenosidimutans]|uniref:methyltransferase RsmF C-terminal domain-like protein n=1 Tax=Arachidicoccus sp. BS20 TaxID=1850526 RepID=UPI0007F0DFA5|nr:hypothetical protein [Arachidicoccus sp. BS20]ANI90769.1 hypothetical protein A9P82_12280 [Arachidicoccus sp. BS20]
MALPLPEALLSSLQNTKGFDRNGFIKVHEETSGITSVRYNPDKLLLYKNALPEDKVGWNPYGFYLSERPSFTFDPLFHAGFYYVQEAGSQFIWEALSQTSDRNEKVKVLDLCAAPGGKSTLLSSYFSNGLIIANEVIKSRANILVENITKWGTDNVVVTNNDPQHFSSLKNYFDIVLIDAPCSGSGLFRKDNDAITEWSEDNVKLCSLRQQRILADVYPSIRQNGLLIYSTCSYSPQEDEEILDWLTDNFSLENIPLETREEWGITQVESSKNKAVGYKFYPDKTRSEGFFISVFRKKDGEVFYENNAKKLAVPNRNEIAEIYNWIEIQQPVQIFKHNNSFIALNENWLDEIPLLQQNLYLKKAGVTIGEIKNKGLVPAHDLAVSTIFAKVLPRVELDKAQSLQYLKRKDFELNDSLKGFVLASFEGINLGWMKLLPNRINNYYPNEWRILKD